MKWNRCRTAGELEILGKPPTIGAHAELGRPTGKMKQADHGQRNVEFSLAINQPKSVHIVQLDDKRNGWLLVHSSNVQLS